MNQFRVRHYTTVFLRRSRCVLSVYCIFSIKCQAPDKGRDSNPPDMIESFQIWCPASRSPDFYQILPIYYKMLKTRKKLLIIFRIFCGLSLWNISYYTFFLYNLSLCLSMMSKCRKWHLREPKFAKIPGGHARRPPRSSCLWRLG